MKQPGCKDLEIFPAYQSLLHYGDSTDLALEHWIAVLLAPLACWVLLNGLDELVIDVAALVAAGRRRRSPDGLNGAPTDAELGAVPERRMAIFVALWREHRVIRRMIENNASRLNYANFDFFVGTYPNDAPTITAVRETMRLFPNVHQAVCPHDGPTSKADCLNWIYQRMLLFEEENGVRFDMVLIHDAEDIIDPDALRWMNYYADSNDMVQIPVLALATPRTELLHGVYCDDFAESQFKDMPARQLLGGFMPSTGVGAGFSRAALERLAARYNNRIFEPACLTEDYEIGFRVRALGLRQMFLPIHIRKGRPIATREYFPRNFRAAVRQRCRWVTGITLQSWEFHSAQETFQQLYWFWRDRKSVAGNLISPVTNLLFLYGGATWMFAALAHRPWTLAQEAHLSITLSFAGLVLQVLHTSVRAWCSAQIYGWAFASVVPVRVLLANWLNCFATVRAIQSYAAARIARKPVRWAKTDHLYPSRAALMQAGKPIGEVLLDSQSITTEELELARATQPRNTRIGEHLVALGLLTEEELYAALARHHGIGFGKPSPGLISHRVTRLVPAELARRWNILPFRIAGGELHLAAAEPPDNVIHEQMRRFSSLELRFHLVTPAELSDLTDEYLGAPM